MFPVQVKAPFKRFYRAALSK